tara:strand:+ start:271 stop:927 length:657 start_codon:yes stop_codon:yes gene_type:complete
MASLLEHPDSQDFFDRTYSLLIEEADRGCVLLGVSLLDEELNKMFRSLVPEDTSNKRIKEIFDGKNVFGSLSSKLDIAYVCRLLPADVVNCLHLLRKLRNKLAHEASTFSIDENLDQIYEIFNKTSGNLTAGMAKLSGQFVYGQFIDKVMETDHPTDKDKKLFDSKEEAYAFLETNDNVKKALFEQRIKVMLVIGIASLGGLIIFHREKILGSYKQQA